MIQDEVACAGRLLRSWARGLLAGLAGAVTLVHAADQPATPGDEGSAWRIALGPALVSTARFPGAGSGRTRLLPYFRASYADRVEIDPVEGLGLLLRPAERLTLRPSVGYSYEERRARDDARLQGLPDVRGTVFAGLALKYSDGGWTTRLQWNERLGARGQRGGLGDLSVQYGFRVGEESAMGVGLSASLMDSAYARNFFAVDAAQAAASGLVRHETGAGLKDLGGFVQASVPMGDGWSLLARCGVRRLQGAAASSPIVAGPGSTSVMAIVTRPL